MNAVFDSILNTSAADLFGSDKQTAEKTYKKLLRQVHPDMVPDAEKPTAEQVFIHLNEMWTIYTRNPRSATTTATATKIKTRKHDYTLGKQIGDDDVFTAYQATYDDGHASVVILIAHDPADEDLVAAYVTSIKKVHAEAPADYQAFFPKLIENFRYTQPDGTHPSLVLDIPGNLFSLAEISKAYPEGLNGRDMAWMWRRMLVALGNTHDVGLIHGAPVADAWLIEPDQHGVVLVGWQYAVETGNALTALPQTYKALYPQAVFDKLPITSALDIRIAAETMLGMLHHNAPDGLRAYLKGCMLNTVPPAAQLLGEFDTLLEDLYGKKSFHRFYMPPL